MQSKGQNRFVPLGDMREKRKVRRNIGNSDSLPLHPRFQRSRGTTTTTYECSATTGAGSVVAGSLDGKIRLYSAANSMKRAKTTFPGLGSPITHVDVTYDGKWILATTDTYLILMCTLFTDKDGKRKTGFSGRMGNKIQAPLLLKLTSEDAHMAAGAIESKIYGGQFSWEVMESGKEERQVVATVGEFSAVWNFQQVKNSGHECYRNQQGLKSCYCYRLFPKNESIRSRFLLDKFGTVNGSAEEDPQVVVATPPTMFKEKEEEDHLAGMIVSPSPAE